MYWECQKEVIVRVWPRSTSIPELLDPAFNKWALLQLQLYKLFRVLDDLHMPNIKDVFTQHLANGGFPHLQNQKDPEDDIHFIIDANSYSKLGTMDNCLHEGCLRQDNYQQIMTVGCAKGEMVALLGSCKLDLVHAWPNAWNDFDFNTLHKWLCTVKESTEIPPSTVAPIQLKSLSMMQWKAFDIIYAHTIGNSQHEQLLMVLIGTTSTRKLYLINAVHHLFAKHACSPSLKITATTGITVVNIHGSMIYSLLSLMSHNLTSDHLHRIQTMMADVKLLVIDEYSFLSMANIDKLCEQLHKIFPQSTHPFGSLKIVLCGDPTQLLPVLMPPIYAHQGSKHHQATCFHLFDKVVELDCIFCQASFNAT